jgi:hypothetical protein
MINICGTLQVLQHLINEFGRFQGKMGVGADEVVGGDVEERGPKVTLFPRNPS